MILQELFESTPKEIERTARNYGGGHAISGNLLLRHGPDAFDQEYSYMGKRYPSQVQKTISTMDQMAEPLDSDTILYRSMPVDPNSKVGDILTDKGFSSTARTSGTPEYLARDRGERVVKILAPAGSPVISLRGHGERNEVVLPRGNRIQVTSMCDENGLVVATLLPQSD